MKSSSTPRSVWLRKAANLQIFASVILGMVLLVQLYSIVPSWLFFAVVAGWLAYLAVAIAIQRGLTVAYPVSLFLAFLTLGLSLPQPEHVTIVHSGPTLASLTFIAGSSLQVGVILTVVAYLILKKRDL